MYLFTVFRLFSYLLTYYLLMYLPTYSSLVTCHLSSLIFYFNSNPNSVYFTESPVRFSGCDTVHMHSFSKSLLFTLYYLLSIQLVPFGVCKETDILYSDRKLFKLQLENLDTGLQVKEKMFRRELDF